jgi:hypothetical protein
MIPVTPTPNFSELLLFSALGFKHAAALSPVFGHRSILSNTENPVPNVVLFRTPLKDKIRQTNLHIMNGIHYALAAPASES